MSVCVCVYGCEYGCMCSGFFYASHIHSPHIPHTYTPITSPIRMAPPHRYWLTWKADGTRYMLFICRWGCYLIDRAFRVRRVQLRFPRTRPHDVPPGVPFPPFHHNTLTDGEMVVDHDKQAGTYRRRYLIYDIMVVNGYCVIDRPFSVWRWCCGGGGWCCGGCCYGGCCGMMVVVRSCVCWSIYTCTHVHAHHHHHPISMHPHHHPRSAT